MIKFCKYILFDLDGTIIDSEPGIINALKYSFNSFGIEVKDTNQLRSFIGPPLKDSFMNVMNFTEEKAEAAISKYREYYSENGIFECTLYDGVSELIAKLHKNGYKILLATCKPEVYAKRILEHFNLNQYFSFVSGCQLDGTRSKKSEVILNALSQMKIDDLSKTVIIGDRVYDIIGAKKTGINSVGVLYGYGNYKELKEAGADYIAEDIKALTEMFV